jgi:signal transduction histidine kinase
MFSAANPHTISPALEPSAPSGRSAAPSSEGRSYEARIRESRVLIVDDMVAHAALLLNLLHRLGFKEVRSLTDPREVFSTIGEWQPHLLILDLSMAHVTGQEIIELLRSDSAGKQPMPIMVVTGEQDPTLKRKVLAAGASEFLLKPYDSSEIVLRIRNLLMMRFLQSELQGKNRELEETVAQRTAALVDRTRELEAALEDLRRSQSQMLEQERLRVFAGMAGGIAHDFNNALNCVIGYTDLMLADEELAGDKQTVLEYARTMNTAGRDAAALVSRLRNLYRPKDEDEEGTFTLVPLRQLLSEAVALSQPKWKAQALVEGRVIDVELQPTDEAEILCNPAEMREVLMNLIFNAADAMPAGGTITLRTRVRGPQVEIGVSDTGTGMPEEVRARCLEPFFSTKGHRGTGLGLSMVAGIVQRHNGTLEVVSELGRGTTIWVRLTTVSDSAGATAPGTLPELTPALRILAVDDEPTARDVISRCLTADGHTVVTAATGHQALAKLATERFDIVITDHAMPFMTGTELAHAIKRQQSGERVILLSGSSDPGAERLPGGIDAWLEKPLSRGKLRNAILGVLS